MRRLNVEAAHVNGCIEKSVYAFKEESYRKSKGPHLQRGELLLLQEVVGRRGLIRDAVPKVVERGTRQRSGFELILQA